MQYHRSSYTRVKIRPGAGLTKVGHLTLLEPSELLSRFVIVYIVHFNK